jgi:hypothetical protein
MTCDCDVGDPDSFSKPTRECILEKKRKAICCDSALQLHEAAMNCVSDAYAAVVRPGDEAQLVHAEALMLFIAHQ